MIEAYLRRLIEDAGLRQSIGANARRYIAETHDIKIGAASYLTFIREVIACRPRKQFLNGVANEITALGIRKTMKRSCEASLGKLQRSRTLIITEPRVVTSVCQAQLWQAARNRKRFTPP